MSQCITEKDKKIMFMAQLRRPFRSARDPFPTGHFLPKGTASAVYDEMLRQYAMRIQLAETCENPDRAMVYRAEASMALYAAQMQLIAYGQDVRNLLIDKRKAQMSAKGTDKVKPLTPDHPVPNGQSVIEPSESHERREPRNYLPFTPVH